jgi:cytoskeletal protein CcmA (bactofilin family)
MGVLDAIDKICLAEGIARSMAWFDRSSGGKREPESTGKKLDVAQPAPDPTVAATAPSPKPETASSPKTAGLVGYLYKGSRVTGQLTFQGSARIEGSVDGEIQCHGTLTIGERAEVRAKISGEIVVIRGRVEGNVVAKEKVELIAPARLYGDVDTPRLIVTEGVVFDGDCSMGLAKQKGGVTAAQNLSAEKTVVAKAAKLQVDFEK